MAMSHALSMRMPWQRPCPCHAHALPIPVPCQYLCHCHPCPPMHMQWRRHVLAMTTPWQLAYPGHANDNAYTMATHILGTSVKPSTQPLPFSTPFAPPLPRTSAFGTCHRVSQKRDGNPSGQSGLGPVTHRVNRSSCQTVVGSVNGRFMRLVSLAFAHSGQR